MERVRGPIDKIYYGHNDSKVFMAFEGDVTSFDTASLELKVTVEETGEQLTLVMERSSSDENTQLVIGERMELALSQRLFKPYRAIHLRFEIIEGSRIIQTMPGYGSLFIDLDETYADNWFV